MVRVLNTINQKEAVVYSAVFFYAHTLLFTLLFKIIKINVVNDK